MSLVGPTHPALGPDFRGGHIGLQGRCLACCVRSYIRVVKSLAVVQKRCGSLGWTTIDVMCCQMFRQLYAPPPVWGGTYAAVARQGANKAPRSRVKNVQHASVVEQEQRLRRVHQSPRARKVIWSVNLIDRRFSQERNARERGQDQPFVPEDRPSTCSCAS